jgi:hypothetical protein
MEMARHDPLLIVAFLLIGASGWLSFVVFRRLIEHGYKTGGFSASWPLIGTMPLAYLYLKARKERGWSPWPAYFIWIFAVAGIAAMVAGLFLLPD